MDRALQIALSNAALAALAAPMVWALCRVARRPALAHVLWLTVLLKLLTPPLWTLPLAIPEIRNSTRIVSSSAAVARDAIPDSSDQAAPAPDPPTLIPIEPENPTASKPDSPPGPALHASAGTDIRWALMLTWLSGSAGYLIVCLVRMVRFSRMLRYATPAPSEVQARAHLLGCRLGLSRLPQIWFVPGPLCPMLWAPGIAARVLVPKKLWETLDEAQRDAILLHELAHWRRRDHWVRWVELAVTTLYWWDPACWWARHELREAEEQCCDAWVLWAMPGAFRNYATALLEAVDFVSCRTGNGPAPSAVPALASGAGQFGHLKRRLTMLKQGNVARALTWGGLATAIGAAAVLLPISATVAGDTHTVSVQTADAVRTNDQAIDDGVKLDAVKQTLDSKAATVLDDAPDARQQLKRAEEEIEQLKHRLEEAEARLAVMQKLADTPDRGRTSTSAFSQPRYGQKTPLLPDRPGVHNGFYRTIVRDSNGNAQIETRRIDPRGLEQLDRLGRIEAQLRSLLKEVRDLRGEVSTSTPVDPQDTSPKE